MQGKFGHYADLHLVVVVLVRALFILMDSVFVRDKFCKAAGLNLFDFVLLRNLYFWIG